MEERGNRSGQQLEYFVVDVFSETQLAGNPLAVVINPGGLTTETMQAIAQEMNLSETTFVERREAETERREGVRVRIFTTTAELPFAGHPTLGTASVLRVTAPECAEGDTVSLALQVGRIPVRFEAKGEGAAAWPVHGEMTQRDPEFGAVLDPSEVAALTGISTEDFDPQRPIQIVSTGLPYAILPLRSAEALGGLRVRTEESHACLEEYGARWFYVLGPTGSTQAGEPAWRARMQFNGREDPATGSAAGCAISYLVRYGAVVPGKRIHLRQGVEMGRPSDIFLAANFATEEKDSNNEGSERGVTEVRVGGSTILVAKGALFLP